MVGDLMEAQMETHEPALLLLGSFPEPRRVEGLGAWAHSLVRELYRG